MSWVFDGVNVCLQKSMIFWLSVYFISNSCANAMFVSVNVTSHKMTDQAVPDELNITLTTGVGTHTRLYLKRVDHIGLNVPVYTHNVGTGGRHVHTREQLQDQQNVGYYQDASNEAVIQVTRTNPLGEKEVRLVLKGELNIAGKRYTLSLGTRKKRNGQKEMQPKTGEAYNLFPQSPTQFVQHDYIEAPPEMKLRFEEVTQVEIPQLSVEGSSLNPPKLTTRGLLPTAPSKRRRRQSQTADNYYVDVVAMADYATYKRFRASSESRTDTLQAMREYYAFIFTGVDLRYQSITSTNYVIHVRLIKVVVSETAAASTFTEKFRVPSKPWDEVDAQSVLGAFSDFSAGAGSDMLNPYDHAMLFTGYDLTSRLANSVTTNATTGLAFTSTLCRTDGKSVSVVEDLGGFQAVDTAAHELGHSMSARHDGDGNSCRSTDRYIMASGSSQVTSSNRLNPWLFSPCSIASFTMFLSNSLRTTRGQTCLLSSLPVDAGVPDVSGRLPGQEFPPDDQCRMIYGSASRLCRGTEFGASANVCTSMFCFDPSTAGTCFEQTAAMGTTCGNGKICLSGQCVDDPRAPAVDDDCVFGDQPGNAFDEMQCPDFVAGFSGFCYQALVRGRCCASCRKAYRTVTDCEYGDKARGCTANICSFTTVSYREQCCGTCDYGSHFTVPASTPTTVNATNNARYWAERQTTTLTTILPSVLHIDYGVCVDIPGTLVNDRTCADAVASSPRLCYRADVNAACCSSCDEVSTGVAASAASCADLQNARINNLTCAAAITQSPFYCYTAKVLEICCFSCQQRHSGIKDCEYGDRTPQKCQSISRTEACGSMGHDCCSTCVSHAHRPITNILLQLVIVPFIHLLISVLLSC